MPLFLFVSTVLIWGTTWYATRVTVLSSPVLTAVFWRFVIAAAVMVAAMAAMGRLRLPRGREYLWLAALGLTIFSTNFALMSFAAKLIPSGLVSVLFATATVMNAVNARLIFGEPIGARMAGAAALGLLGIGFLFGPDVMAGVHEAGMEGTLLAIALGLGGTFSFSLGNMVSRRNNAAGMGMLWANAWGMVFGLGFLAVAVAVSGSGFRPPAVTDWWAAVAYLGLVGSVLGFAAYLGLVARVGATRAAYTTVMFPVVALTISWLMEGYQWHLPALIGLVLVTAGNVLAFARGRKRAVPPPEAGVVAPPAPPQQSQRH